MEIRAEKNVRVCEAYARAAYSNSRKNSQLQYEYNFDAMRDAKGSSIYNAMAAFSYVS